MFVGWFLIIIAIIAAIAEASGLGQQLGAPGWVIGFIGILWLRINALERRRR